jgi:hypothetical protein
MQCFAASLQIVLGSWQKRIHFVPHEWLGSHEPFSLNQSDPLLQVAAARLEAL